MPVLPSAVQSVMIQNKAKDDNSVFGQSQLTFGNVSLRDCDYLYFVRLNKQLTRIN